MLTDIIFANGSCLNYTKVLNKGNLISLVLS